MVATTTQVGSIVEEIGADDVALTVLLEPGARVIHDVIHDALAGG